ncbi:MAG TPA: translocation/assembly module TamB domain-containing protein, partial [Acetobacteraceae bacterium]|nr:translocation/assembly module TamB domain-containing protein [Acetobacteraceae bacterium]
GTAAVRSVKLDATVRDPETDPDVTAALDVTGFSAGGIGGDARVTAQGRQAALGVRLQATVPGLAGADLAARGTATVDVPAKAVRLSALDATWKGETLRLLGPARITAADGIAVDRLRLGLRQAVIEVAGRLSPTLDLTAALRNLTPEVAQAVMPTLKAAGVVNAEARLTGTTARPTGTARLTASGLHATTGAAAGLPPANLTADARLAGTTAEVDARFSAGGNRLTLAGTAPIDPQAAMRLRAAGSLDLATLNPILTAQGQRVRGTVTLDATVTGTEAAPRAAGTLRLAGGDVQDFANGAHVTALAALVEADGDTIRLTQFSGRAGKGTLGARGSVGLGGAMPVDLRVTADHAQPLATDLLTATLDADVTLRGEVKGQLAAGGQVRIDSADIRIPDKLPTSIAVLDVRRPGQAPPPPPAPGPDIALDVTVTAPGQVFVRGRGLFAEVAGRMHVGGTAAQPIPTGVFRLRRGQLNLAGTTLTFTSGDVRFLGSGKLDPALNLVATSTTPTVAATLTVGGYASAPKITLSSVPPLPQDEILAQLLFHQSAGSLSPVQLAAAAAALAQISGVGGGALNPLEGLRERLGLDRLTIGGGQNGTGPSLEAGRYVARGVYLGAKQSADGTGTQATMQVDLAKGLKLETDVGTGSQTSATGATATQDPYGTSIGLTYTFRY